MNEEIDDENGDAAWVTIEAPFDADWLAGFITDLERVFRINSLIEYSNFDKLGDSEGVFRIKGKNLSTGKMFDTTARVSTDNGGVLVCYDSGIKSSTRLQVEQGADGAACLVITDDYSATPRSERENRLDEVDNSLVQWGRDIHRYLQLWKRWSFVPGWRWYMTGFWQKMKPSARRIAFMLIIITAMEFVVFLAVFAIFWLELGRLI